MCSTVNQCKKIREFGIITQPDLLNSNPVLVKVALTLNTLSQNLY